jgi:hypothetical protein
MNYVSDLSIAMMTSDVAIQKLLSTTIIILNHNLILD